jgi:predicted acylesterase/phospholipase RssA
MRNIVDTYIYIKPDISQYGVISFDKGKEIIRKGEEATFAVYAIIKNSRQVYSIQKTKTNITVRQFTDKRNQ